MNRVPEKHHAHELIERLPDSQIGTAVRFLEFMLLDPVARTLATAPPDDEPVTEQDRRAVAASREYFRQDPEGGIPFEQVVAECGFTMDQVRRHQGE